MSFLGLTLRLGLSAATAFSFSLGVHRLLGAVLVVGATDVINWLAGVLESGEVVEALYCVRLPSQTAAIKGKPKLFPAT